MSSAPTPDPRRAASRDRRARRARRGAVRQVPLRTHWLLLGTLVVTLTLALLIEGYTQHMFGVAGWATRRARSR